MGLNASSLNTDRFGIVRATANAAITAGDLVSNMDGGTAAPVNSALGVSGTNYSTAGVTAIVTSQVIASNNYGGITATGRRILELGNGNIVEAYLGDGSASTTNYLNFRVRSPLNGGVVGQTVVSTDATINGVRLIRLSTARFLVAWSTATGPTLKFTIYNNDGTVFLAATSVSTLGATSTYTWDVEVLANGDIVFAYDKITSRNCVFTRYNSSGVIQGTETSIESGAQPTFICVKAVAAGGFIASYYRQAATSAHKVAKYDSAGSIVGSLVTISSSQSFGSGDADKTVLELSNGNIAVLCCQSANARPQITVFNSALTQLSSAAADPGANAATSFAPGMCATSSGFAIVYAVSSTFIVRTFDFTGAGIATSAALSVGQSVANGGTHALAVITPHGAGGFTVFVSGFDGATNYAAYAARVSAALSLIGSSSAISSPSGQSRSFWWEPHSSGTFLFMENYTNQVIAGVTVATVRQSVLGVALDTVAAGATVRVATQGSYTLNANYASGGQFDQRTATVPGTRGSVVGNSAILYGMS